MNEKEETIESVRNLVVSIALKYLGRGVELEDLVQSGIEGALLAYNKFDRAAGAKF